MTDPVAAVEAALCAAYREEAGHYARALTAVDNLPAAFAAAQDASSRVREIQERLEQVAQIEEQIGPQRRRWLDARREPGGLLQAAVCDLMHLVKRLAEGLHAAERAALARKHRLAVELYSLARGRHMQRAYGDSLLSRPLHRD
jgi:hypothetical protein